jgi:DNA-binding CsgD family transcriptional regulator
MTRDRNNGALHHLAHAYQKLDISSRTELPATRA